MTSTTQGTLTRREAIHFGVGRSRLRLLRPGPPPLNSGLPTGRVPRVAKWMALALKLVQHLDQGDLASQAEAARLGGVTRARFSQILTLVHLAPDLQEAVLFLPRIERGGEPLQMRHLLPLTRLADWQQQRDAWRRLAERPTAG